MGRSDMELAAAKKAYRSAKEVGNRREEARWANVVGDILKNRGEYFEALHWVRKDYEISEKFLPGKDLLPTCQSLGELYLRIENFSDALHFQKEHLDKAKEANDLVEQQRAYTQLGRTYHELFFKNDDQSALHNAKKCFKSSMSLARTLKENPPDSKSSFLKEYVDAHNNAGMLEMDLDNLEEAEKILTRGLEICDEEEVDEEDDGRTRLHHNLGFVYTQLRMWSKAKEHIKKDILICKSLGHRQGEAKGYINLGELYGKVQKFEEALRSYQNALELANSMEDELALASQIKENIRVVQEYVKVMEEIKKEEQNLKKLKRSVTMAKGTSGERKCLRQLMTSLDRLIEKTVVVAAWPKHREFAKMKKTIASELCDKEKLGDSYLVVGESYDKLRNFKKARKWYTKSWEIYELIGNLEGQAIAKINLGGVLDSEGDWKGALKTFEEGYRIAVEANKIRMQILALENMHYSYMMRFDDVQEARSLKLQIDNLQILVSSEPEPHDVLADSCSETDTEGNDSFTRNRYGDCGSSQSSELLPIGKPVSSSGVVENDEASSSFHRCDKLQKPVRNETSPKSLSKSLGSLSTAIGRKRNRVILSDDEDDVECLNTRRDTNPSEDFATSNEFKDRSDLQDLACELQDVLPDGCKHDSSSCNPVNLEESSCSYKCSPPEDVAGRNLKTSDNKRCFKVKIEDVCVYIEAESCMFADELDLEALKVQVACKYYLQLSSQRRSHGLLPIIESLKSREQVLASTDVVEVIASDSQGDWIEASTSGWVQKRLIQMYIECCQKSSEMLNMKLLMKLYNLEISEDEVIVSDCELQDKSVGPILEALSAQKAISVLDLSHNMLGNATMEKLQDRLTKSGQKYGAFMLDLHCNTFGPTALFQICECPVLVTRLEVLNISGNRLTDACGTYLSTILRTCKALYSLNIERCSITSRTIQVVADALDSSSVLAQLYVGYNNPVSGSSLANLLRKLAKLERFSELGLSGLKLNKPTLDGVCHLARSSCLSGLVLGATNIGCDGALQLTESLFHETQELVKFDLSYCGLTPKYFEILKTSTPAFCNIIELNLAGNPIMAEGRNALASLLANPQCCVKVMVLTKCHLGLSGIVQIIKSLAGNESLEEVNLAGNIGPDYQYMEHEMTDNPKSKTLVSDSKLEIFAVNAHTVEQAQSSQSEQHGQDITFDQLEVADSYDNDEVMVEHAESGLADSATSQGESDALKSKNYFIEELSTAISNARQLQLVDLSDNGFSAQVADLFYDAWSSGTRTGSPRRHVKGQILHLFIQGKNCCGIKPCCRKV